MAGRCGAERSDAKRQRQPARWSTSQRRRRVGPPSRRRGRRTCQPERTRTTSVSRSRRRYSSARRRLTSGVGWACLTPTATSRSPAGVGRSTPACTPFLQRTNASLLRPRADGPPALTRGGTRHRVAGSIKPQPRTRPTPLDEQSYLAPQKLSPNRLEFGRDATQPRSRVIKPSQPGREPRCWCLVRPRNWRSRCVLKVHAVSRRTRKASYSRVPTAARRHPSANRTR